MKPGGQAGVEAEGEAAVDVTVEAATAAAALRLNGRDRASHRHELEGRLLEQLGHVGRQAAVLRRRGGSRRRGARRCRLLADLSLDLDRQLGVLAQVLARVLA